MNSDARLDAPAKPSMDPPLIVGIGTVVVDDVVELDRFPEPDTKMQIRARWRQVGGPVPTALVAAARLAHPPSDPRAYRCAFAGKWADDADGAFVVADLEREAIDLQFCERAPMADNGNCEPHEHCHTGFAQVWVDRATGGRNIAFSRGQFPPLCRFDLPDSTCILHLDGAHPQAALAAAQQAHERGVTVVLDAGSLKPGMDELFRLADVVVGSSQFLRSITGSADIAELAELDEAAQTAEASQAGAAMLAFGVRRMVMTHGAAGAWICSNTSGGFDPSGTPEDAEPRLMYVPTFEVDAVDTTGAGDVFCGGLIHALAMFVATERSTGKRLDIDANLPAAVRMGCAAAAHKCKNRGNRSSLPNHGDLVAMIQGK